MTTADSWDVIRGDEQCRDGHYRTKQDLRADTVTGLGADLAVELDPNDSTSLQAQNPTDLAELRVGVASEEAAGIPAIWNTMLYGISEMGPVRSAEAFLKINQVSGLQLRQLDIAASAAASCPPDSVKAQPAPTAPQHADAHYDAPDGFVEAAE